MIGRTVGLLLAVAIAGCAVIGRPSPEQAETGHLIGHYYQGDGLGTNIYLELRLDGTYEARWHGCLGDYGTATGSWSLDSGSVHFEPLTESGMLAGYLKRARIRRALPHYKLVPEAGSAEPGDVLRRHFPGRR